MINKAYSEMAQLINSELTGRGQSVIMYDEKGDQTADPAEANRFWADGLKMMIVLGKTDGRLPQPMIGFYRTTIADPEEKQKVDDIVEQIKQVLTKNNRWGFSIRTYEFGQLEPRHLKHMNLSEASLWNGSTRTSYYPIDSVDVVIRHNRPWSLDSLTQPQRWRRIKQIFLYLPDGQRFKCPFSNVIGAKAMAQHLHQNKVMHDEHGELICKLVKLAQDLGNVQQQCRSAKHWPLFDEIKSNRKQIKNLLSNISQSRMYEQSLTSAQTWLKEWSKTPVIKRQPEPVVSPEMAQLENWFESFDPTKIISEDREDEIRNAWERAGHDKYKTLDDLKRNVPGWQARFEDDPDSVTEEIEKAIAELEKESK